MRLSPISLLGSFGSLPVSIIPVEVVFLVGEKMVSRASRVERENKRAEREKKGLRDRRADGC